MSDVVLTLNLTATQQAVLKDHVLAELHAADRYQSHDGEQLHSEDVFEALVALRDVLDVPLPCAPNGQWAIDISSTELVQVGCACVCGHPDCTWHAATYAADFVFSPVPF